MNEICDTAAKLQSQNEQKIPDDVTDDRFGPELRGLDDSEKAEVLEA